MRYLYVSKRSIAIKSSSRRGFTLLETLLAVAILLILTLLVFQGFAATMYIASNTSSFEKTGNVADSQANAALSNTSTLTPSTGTINLECTSGYSFDLDLSINKYSAEPAPASNFGSQSYVSAHRHVFTYKGP